MGGEMGFYLALAAMAAASYACRVAGYLLMGWVPITPRLEAALKAMPLGVMVGIVTPAASSGRAPELLGLVAVAVVMRLSGKDVIAAVVGAAVVALARRFLA
ncbi:AzlD family protein [Ramlibacter tataouinensis]|nr:AzlD domain-containing protein [Ramlibacter tataouinensis]